MGAPQTEFTGMLRYENRFAVNSVHYMVCSEFDENGFVNYLNRSVLGLADPAGSQLRIAAGAAPQVRTDVDVKAGDAYDVHN